MMTIPPATVMVVHREPPFCNSLTDDLSTEGYRVISATSGPDALEMAAEESPDLILLDSVMPELDGVAILRQLREQGHDGTVIMLHAQGTMKSAREAMLLDAYDYIAKPYNIDFLKSVLREGLERPVPAWRDYACVH